MSQRVTFLGLRRPTVALGWLTGAILAGALASPAAAYVVVTIDNRVYDVPTKPEIRGDMVLFVVDGNPVSLRVYEVNVTKTNELNYMLDQGAGAPGLTAQLRSLKPAIPADERLIESSELHQVMEADGRPDYRLVLQESRSEQSSFSDSPGQAGRGSEDYSTRRDDPGPRSRFTREAREALAEAERQVDQPADTRTAEPAPRAPARMDDREAERAAGLDAEIAAEQEYLRKLTGGEVVVSDLEGEVDRTMDKIKRLQRRRDRMGDMQAEAAAMAPPSDYQPSGSYPAGSREAKWERNLADAQARLQRLRSQQGALPEGPSRDREMTDEMIGETQYEIERLQRKLSNAR